MPPKPTKSKSKPSNGAASKQAPADDNPKCRGELNIPKPPEVSEETPEVDALTSWALQGKTDCTYPETAKIVRIFTSSTFTDTRTERNALMARVYPKLRNYCRERGYDFQVVDMRWGVRDEATDDHMTSELCMRELAKCQKLSTGPVFITFLAQKYGYRPFPPKILTEEFERILESVEDPEDRKLLTDWFVRDDNRAPPIYQLSPIRQRLPHYADDSDPDLKKQDRDAWWAAFEKMQVILRAAASKSLDDETEIHKYYWAVTEEEVYNGILAAENTDATCYWFRRHLEGLSENTTQKMARRFMDVAGGKPDEEALNFLSKLKDEKVTGKLPKDNITSYQIQWTEQGVDPEVPEHADYVNTFCADFNTVLATMVDHGIEQRMQGEIKDILTLESMKHAQFAQQKCAMFHGRQDYLQQIKSFVMDEDKCVPLVICGEPGAGKTSVMAKLVSSLPEWQEHAGHPIVVRFLGTSTSSSNTRDLLRSVCSQILQINYQKSKIEDIPQSLKKLMDYFKKLLQEQSSPLTIILDSLDQLRDYGGELSSWVPKELPTDVRLVLSCIPSEQFVVGPKLKEFLDEDCFLDVPEFTTEDIKEVIEEWLKGDCRALQEEQMKLLMDACKNCALPLFVKLAYDSALLWRSYTPLEECSFGQAVHDSIELLFERIKKYHGKVLVRLAFGYVTAAKSGLSANEIEDILSLDDEVLNDVYQYHMPPLRRLPPLLWVRIQDEADAYLTASGADGIQVVTWYHRQFRTVATERYLTEETKGHLHSITCEYFQGLWANGKTKDFVDKKGNAGTSDRLVPAQPYLLSSEGDENERYNLRKLNELPYHMTLVGDNEALKTHVFFYFEYLYYKIKSQSLDSVLDDLDFAKEQGISDQEMSQLYKCLEMSRDMLMADIRLLPACLLGRLSPYDTPQNPAIHQLLDQAARPPFDCFYSSQGHLKMGGGPLLGKFAGHTAQIQSMDVNKDNTKLLTSSTDKTLRLWDLDSTRELKSIDLTPVADFLLGCQFIPNTKFCNEEKWALLSCPYFMVVLVSLETGMMANMIQLDPMEAPGALTIMQESNLLFVIQSEGVSAWDVVKGEKVDQLKVPKTVEIADALEGKAADYIQALGSDLMFYKTGTNVVKFVRYGTKKKTDTYALFGKKDIPTRLCRFATLSGGYLVCYHFFGASLAAEPGKSVIDIIDIATASRLHSFPEVDAGYIMGSIEKIISTGPTSFALTTFPSGSTCIVACDVHERKLREVLKRHSIFPHNMIGTNSNQMIIYYVSDMTVMEFVDLGRAEAERDATDEQLQIFGVIGLLPGSSRFVLCTALLKLTTQQVVVWDLHRRCYVRFIDCNILGMFSVMINKTTLAGLDPNNGTFYVIDIAKGKTLVKKEKMAYEVPDKQLWCGVSETGHVVFVGPKENTLSGVDVKTGKSAWTIDGGPVKLGAILVSENGRIAICETQHPASFVPGGGVQESQLHVFDLKAKKKISDIKCMTVNALRILAVLQKQAFLTPDGQHYVLSVFNTEHHFLVFATRDGSSRKAAFTVGNSPQSLIYSKMLDSAVCGQSGGTISLVKLSNLEITEIDIGFGELVPTMVHECSPDGRYVLVMPANSRSVVHVVDLVKQTRQAIYRAENQIDKALFTQDNKVLMVVTRTSPGLAQLYFYEAGETQSTGAEKQAGTGNDARKASTSTASKPAGNKNGTARKNSKRTSRASVGDVAVPAGEEAQTLTREKEYLQSLQQEEDVFGEPATFECK